MISSEYLYIAMSGVDSGARILPGRPKGGVGILYKKSLSDKIMHVSSQNRRVPGIITKLTYNFSCLLLSVYLPCDNYSTVYVNHAYTECIDYIESIVVHLYVVVIIILLLIDRTHKLNF